MTLEELSDDPRVTVRHAGAPKSDGKVVVYWMQRAQRASDNPALDVAVCIGNLLHKPVVVFFGLNPFVPAGNLRHYRFLADGLRDIGAGLEERRVGFVCRRHPHHRLEPFVAHVDAAIVIGDENPLRWAERWREQVAERIRVPFWTVDADVVVPSALIDEEQYAARTIRPRIQRWLPEFLAIEPEPCAHVSWRSVDVNEPAGVGLDPRGDVLDGLSIDRSVGPVDGFAGGTGAARRVLQRFLAEHLAGYDVDRNHPERSGTSGLSPYLHFGHIGPREVATAIRHSGAPAESVAAFLEQLIVRRELAVNYVRFNDAYDRLEGCERWARLSLERHRSDARTHLYTFEQFEHAATHDPLWNAAQRQMVRTGWMHGYVRMYWAKKILEWTDSAAEAFEIAITLNDRYELDGRDPNGYTNIAWAIGGKHDRPWPSRPVYGSIRSMSLASTSRKFDANRYIGAYA